MRPSLFGSSFALVTFLVLACSSTQEEESGGGTGGAWQTVVCVEGQQQACELCDGVRKCVVELREPLVTSWSACCDAPAPPAVGGFGGASGGTSPVAGGSAGANGGAAGAAPSAGAGGTSAGAAGAGGA